LRDDTAGHQEQKKEAENGSAVHGAIYRGESKFSLYAIHQDSST
jgi:hypothetical protein